MNSITSQLIKSLWFSAALSLTVPATAQKLPAVQKISVYEAGNAKANQQAGKFRAYNNRVDVYYTIANNEDNLFLTLQATDPNIILKIAQGGLTFTLNNSGKQDDKNNEAITFPIYDKSNPPLFLILNNQPPLTKDAVRNKAQLDSFVNAKNQQLGERFKFIGVAGLKAINDPELSIYNEQGLKAAAALDDKIYLTCRLSIPLKYLDIVNGKFNYNLKLNGSIAGAGGVMTHLRDDMITFTGADGVNYVVGKNTPENSAIAFATNFWGEYTLAKK